MANWFSCFHILLLLLAFLHETARLCNCATTNLGCIEEERLALTEFKNTINVTTLNRLSSWIGNECCTWEGVSCSTINSSVHVIQLHLPNPVNPDPSGFITQVPNRIKANSVSPALMRLKFLEHIDLSWNDFSGSSIPAFLGSMRRLRYLNLSNARFNGLVPNQLGNLPNLHSLDLSSSQAEYDFQLFVANLEWLPRLGSLRQLDLSWMNLSTAVADLVKVLNMLPSLTYLRLQSCGLGGNDLFVGYVNSTLLEHFDVSVNAIGGSIPVVTQNMHALKVLDLSANLFNSSIPPWLGNLKSLVHLNLGFNYLTGGVPNDLGNLTSLEFLDLSFNGLEGSIPTSLWNLCSLKVLDFTMNTLNGTVTEPSTSVCIGNGLQKLSLRWNKIRSPLPVWFGQFPSLKLLDVAYNSFYGQIPASFGGLSKLAVLDLSHNQLNGTVPASLGQLSELKQWVMSTNSLEGTMSEVHFANLSNLKQIDFSVNSLAFQVDPNWVPPFQLSYISMKSCILGPRFPTWLGTQNETITLYISNTSISDVLPPWFPNSKFHFLDLSFNQIGGRIPTFSTPSSLYMNLYLSNNRFEGPLPTFPFNVNRLDLTNNLISGTLPQHIGNMTPTLDNLLLSGNQISGSIPNSLCKIYTLRVLDLSKNGLSGEIPNCWSYFKILVVLDLSENNLTGIIPSSFGNASSLKSLHLSSNNLHGDIPSSLRQCTNLVILDFGENEMLSGYLPTWIGESLFNLEILRLRSNKLKGNIPSEICQLSQLQVLDLAQNSMSGTIPPCFGNFSGMTSGNGTASEIGIYKWSTTYGENLIQFMKGKELEYTKTLRLLINMDISGNQMTGTIPEELTNLIALRGLNLSGNQLQGPIPNAIGKLTWLESLDFSRNQLSGSIPASIALLNALSHLNLSYNKLSGKIPSGNQLQTLIDPSIYTGNSQLCGAPLSECATDEPPPAEGEGEDEDNGSDLEWLYISMSTGYVTGLWGVLGVMIYKKSWRDAYLKFADKVFEKICKAANPKAWKKKERRSAQIQWSSW
ncbi:hypothetical protein FNV43_RR18903 [Rhamnella rubrinervis]|uniref:Leucine-rich repeat-containing N-terminal plant-type domain-containing protein n=1 Tax=Rhamnella rubrinervis TaxID=2594499 RepID=A0A8K0GW22_9ROSA|nr:hypothetical protein FNV43_RR18903 [Rhamnella rubrinervis]